MRVSRTSGTWIAAVGFLLVGAALRLQGIASQPLISDEEWVAATAIHYVESGQFGPTMWYHPNLRNLVVWAIGEGVGHGPVALRATSLALGTLTIPLVGLLLYLLTEDRAAALAASFLLALDQVHVTFSRQAIQETWTTFFFVTGTTAAVAAWRRRRAWLLAAAGLAFGLGVSSKFHALLPLAVCGSAGLWIAWRERSPALAAWVMATLGALPATVYLATYAPWFARGYGAVEWLEMQRVLLAKMATHAGNPMDQLIDVAAWQWFLRPMGYANFVLHDGAPFVTIAYSNPTVWLLVLPATALVALKPPSGASSVAGERFILSLFAVSYLPLALTSRPIWLLSSLAVFPFAVMILGLATSRLLRLAPAAKGALIVYACIVAATSLALYPLACGGGEAHAYLRPITERFRPPPEMEGVIR